MKKEKSEVVNLLELIPYKNIEWEKGKEGLIILLRPKFKNPIFSKYLLPRLKNPYYKIKLDKIGSYVWELCDGRNKVKDIGFKLKQEFGQEVEPVYDRLALFFKELEKGNFIKFSNIPK